MPNSFLSGHSAVSGVRKPILEISFGNGGGGGGLATAVLGVLGGGADPWAQHVAAVAVEAGFAPGVNVVRVRLAATEQAPTAALGDSGTVSLGYADSTTELVFTGLVEEIHPTVHGERRLIAVDGGAALSRLRVNQSYEQQKAGDIVRDLAGRAEVDTDAVEDGISLPFCAVDDGQSAYQHIAGLARKSGFLAYFTPEGKLRFGPPAAGQPVQTFRYGEDVLALQMTETNPVFRGVRVIGEGAAGSQGQEAWSWLVKDPAAVTAEAGEGDSPRLQRDASLRNAEAVMTAAQAWMQLSGLMNQAGSIWVPGAPAVTVGATIELAEMPSQELNGQCLVLGVGHYFSKRRGFVSRIELTKAAGAGGMLGGLL